MAESGFSFVSLFSLKGVFCRYSTWFFKQNGWYLWPSIRFFWQCTFVDWLQAMQVCLSFHWGSGGVLGAVLERYWGFLVASWGHLGPSWEPLGASSGRFGASWRPKPNNTDGTANFEASRYQSWLHFLEVFECALNISYFIWSYLIVSYLILFLKIAACRRAKKHTMFGHTCGFSIFSWSMDHPESNGKLWNCIDFFVHGPPRK